MAHRAGARCDRRRAGGPGRSGALLSAPDPDGPGPLGVRADGWGWRHAGRHEWAVRGLDLRIEPGERVLLLGASGAGKSTLLHAVAGVLGDDEGEQEGTLRIGDRDARRTRGAAGLVLQDPDANIVLHRMGDDTAFGPENIGAPVHEIGDRVARALAAVDLRMPLATATSTLSGGRKQRLGVAGVLAMRPGALLLDEPTANLDPAGVLEVRDAVVAAADATGATLVVVEHRIEVWMDVVDRIVVLEPGGGVRADGPPREVLRGDGDALFTEGVWIPRRPPRAARDARTPGTALLSGTDLTVGRGGVAVAAPPDLTVGRGGATAIVGANGLGKSTFALTLAGLIAPVAGRVVASEALRGPLGPDALRWRSRDLVRRIGTVFQNPEHQFVRGTVRAELAVGLEAIGMRGRDADDRVDELLERLRLTAIAQANPFTLSGGEKRRLSVATALATSPAVLVVDEPTFGQDSRTWAGLVDLVNAELDAGTAVVAVTHDIDFAAAIGAAPFTWAPAGAAA